MSELRRTKLDKNEPNENAHKLYHELASWWHLLAPPSEYAEDAVLIREMVFETSAIPISTLLDLGSGGGNIASYLKDHFRMTLVDRSAEMLAISRELNPECEHILGDFRTIRLGRLFDVVLVHDAIMYMTTENDLCMVLETAFLHLCRGGVALFMPDYVSETFTPSTKHGGIDAEGLGARYLQWSYDPDASDHNYVTDFAYLLREKESPTWVEFDRHMLGLFSKDLWVELIGKVGFDSRVVRDSDGRFLFVGVKY